MKENKNAPDTLKHGIGTAADVTVLFAAMARAIGLEARIAAVPDREDIFFKDAYANGFFLSGRVVIVKDGESTKFVEPANRYDSGGGLRWQRGAAGDRCRQGAVAADDAAVE